MCHHPLLFPPQSLQTKSPMHASKKKALKWEQREWWHRKKVQGQVPQQLKPHLLPSPTWQLPKPRKP
ncbi:hypothetical protein Fmac_029438 [Flemingia macrophylla]|uniref:Uncharacterized protein n=1 Tax=Flemingia macrophylla TaxID=520843 RepID=A0ABD1LAB8_9FABA